MKHNTNKWMRHEHDIQQYYWPKLHEWMERGMPPAGTAFTMGLGRFMAQLCEEAVLRAKESVVMELEIQSPPGGQPTIPARPPNAPPEVWAKEGKHD